MFQTICIGPRNGCQDGREEVHTSAVVTLTQASTLALVVAETQRSWNKADRDEEEDMVETDEPKEIKFIPKLSSKKMC